MIRGRGVVRGGGFRKIGESEKVGLECKFEYGEGAHVPEVGWWGVLKEWGRCD